MIVKLENYHGKYKIVSLALNQTVREELLKDEIEFVYISENDIRLYPEDVVVSKDKNIIEKAIQNVKMANFRNTMMIVLWIIISS